jgi:AraC family transcriptional regulator of adaptative response / DNA-3-methyladenine glycosylase II
MDARGTVRLPYRTPFDWAAIVRFLALRAAPGVEAIEGDAYRRTVDLDEVRGVIEVRPEAGRPALILRADGFTAEVVHRVRRLFDLDADSRRITRHLRRSAVLAPLVARAPGLRVPGAWDGFEVAVRAVLGQQVAVRAATALAGRLVEVCGEPIPTGRAGLSRLFPPPARLAEADLAAIGLPRARAATIRGLAAAVARGEPLLDAGRDLADRVARLCAIPGIGPWTAHYIAMRLGDPDAFPATDLGLRRALAVRGRRPEPAQVVAMGEAWRPWRAYAVLYLWTEGGTAHDDSHRTARDARRDDRRRRS